MSEKAVHDCFLVFLKQHPFVILCKDQPTSHEILAFSGLMTVTYTDKGKCVSACCVDQEAVNI